MQNPADYRHTLAITFTNKATAEMKSRILEALVSLADGQDSSLKQSLEEELELDDLANRARKALDLILHDYSSFSIHTIDSFFQRIIRGLAREMNLPVTLQLQLNHDEVKEEITEKLFEDIGKDEQLTKWITELIEQKLFRDGRWDINNDLKTICGELLHSHRTEIKTFDKKQIKEFYGELQALQRNFETRLRTIGKTALKKIADSGMTIDDFSGKSKGPAGYFLKIAADKPDPAKYPPNVTTRNAAEDLSKWVTKTSKQKEFLLPLAEHVLIPLLNEALNETEENYSRYLGAVLVLQRIYLLGILHDLNKKLAQYRQEKNLLLLSDTPRILNRFISESDTSFVFEKTGNHYRHFLIDEFQDTSGIQWKNLLPLVINSLGSGHFTMVVGDAKQSIYRWRGGDIKLLGGTLAADLKSFSSIFREEILDTNYRSRKDIVEFNNALFASVPDVVEREQGQEHSALLRNFYSDGLKQHFAPANDLPGFVQIRFLEKDSSREADFSEEEDDRTPKKWKDQALSHLPDTLHRLLEQGYTYGDIAILVRMNEEGNQVAGFLADHGITQVVSSDSLLIKNNPKIIFLVNAFRFIADPGNHIARSELLFSYCTFLQKNATAQPLHPLFTDFTSKKSRKNPGGQVPELFHSAAFDNNLFNQLLPPEFTDRIPSLSKLPVYEAAETCCRIFKLDQPEAYLERFLDLVLEYSNRQHSSIRSFLEWWDESSQADACSVVVPEGGNAIRILTIHKSKGLQFPVVLMPFCDWKFTPSSKSLIWVHSDEKPFAGFGELPLLPSKNLSESVFHQSYAEETVHFPHR
jgi:ATP-dependent exoDNAse (exonuclease V) beta subunit